MTAQISIYGRLGADPAERTSAAGKPWASASVAVNAGRDTDEPPLWLKIIAFGKVAEDLGRHAKGDLVAAMGRLAVNRWTDRDGNQREDLQVVAEQIVSARTVRPGGGKRKAEPEQHGQPEPLEDEVPF